MALVVTHAFTATAGETAGAAAAGKVVTSEWNAAHTLAGIASSSQGGTGNGFTKFTGPTTSEKTFTLPDASSTLLYSGGALGVPASGTLTNCTGLPAAGVVGTAAVLTGNAFTGSNSTTLSIGAVSTDGLLLTNTTAAAAGAQQWSPRLRFTGQGWKTTATAASQTVDWIAELVPVQGAANPTANLVFSGQINGGGYTKLVTFDTFGGITQNTGYLNQAGNQWTFATSSGAGGFVVIGKNSQGITLRSGSPFCWAASSTDANNAGDTFLIRGAAAATLQQGNANAASPVAQTLQAQGSRSGTDSDVGGANYTIRSGAGTGTGTLSSLILQSPIAVASGTGAQTQTTGLTIKGGAYVSTAYTVGTLPASPVQGMRCHVTDSNAASYTAGIGAVVAAGGSTVVPVFYDGTNWRIG